MVLFVGSDVICVLDALHRTDDNRILETESRLHLKCIAAKLILEQFLGTRDQVV